MTTMLEVCDLCVRYDGANALRDVSFDVMAGEIVVLLGSNGAGKSTVIKTISGLVKPESGTITYDGVRLDLLPASKVFSHHLAHVPEGRKLFHEMSVEENLILGSLKPDAKEKREETLKRVYDLFPQLKNLSGQAAGNLSGGEQQMVAVGRGLMGLPKMIMLDEPSLGLSPKLALDIFRIVKTINGEGVTVLLVEQNVKSSLAICHRGYVLENGRIIMSGTGSELAQDERVKEAYLGI